MSTNGVKPCSTEEDPLNGCSTTFGGPSWESSCSNCSDGPADKLVGVKGA